MKVEKCIRKGKVAVVISPGFGSGWSTWNRDHAEFLLFDMTIAKMVENGSNDQIESYLNNLGYPGYYSCNSLSIEWVPEGTRFYVEEYDGHESIVTVDDLSYTA